MDQELLLTIEANRYRWELESKRKLKKNAFLVVIALAWAIAALFTEYGLFMSLAIVVGLFTMFILEPWTKNRLRRNKNYCDEFG